VNSSSTIFDSATQQNIDSWLEGNYDEKTKEEIRRQLTEKPEELIDAFYTKLDFGTGGLRGIMGIGSNRMNLYTVGTATQGLANYINKQPNQGIPPSVLIGYDCRHNSKLFANEAARIFAANGIATYIYNELRPVPLVSFGCRYKKCIAAVMITASHNPPEYNGYKVYWSDGAQVLPPHDKGIIAEVNAIADVGQIKKTPLPNPIVKVIENEIDKAYIEAVRDLRLYPQQDEIHGSQLKIVYTSLHGAGITVIPEVLADWGFNKVLFVDEQVIPDGDFPTVHSPNPEETSALKMGIERLVETHSDILIATDPDTDRLGVVAYHQGKPIILNGNETVCICLRHICEGLKKQNKLPANAAFVKTIVTTELFQSICDDYGRPCFNVLTGFKYIGEKIREWEASGEFQYIYGGEESYGSLLGTCVRDKDAVLASALIAEVALNAKLQGLTLIDLLHQLYQKYGVYREKLISVTFKGKEGVEKMKSLMAGLRSTPPKSFAGISVLAMEDYANSTRTEVISGKTEPISLPQSDVLFFWLEDGSKLVIRPSGTEPKIKIYCGVNQKSFPSIDKAIEDCDLKADRLLTELKNYLS
jgi:phosphoglucomutase/phosphomannomutase